MARAGLAGIPWVESVTDKADASTIRPLNGKRALVIGLGRFGGGVAVTRWLVAQGVFVTVTDAAPADSLRASVAELDDCPVDFKLGGHDSKDLEDADLVVVNPAVDKRRSVFFHEIIRRGIPWTTEINLFCHRCPGTVIGVTGSFGKSTTCAMIAAALERWIETGGTTYSRSFLGGNIGHSLLPELPTMGPDSLVVLEISNAQLDDLPRIGWSPHVAVITNISPHHLDRYADFGGYVDAKLNILANSSRTRHVFYGDLVPGAREKLQRVSRDLSIPAHGVTVPPLPLRLRVPGDHNLRNASMAFSVCRHFGVGESFIRDALADFRGLPHRLEFVRALDGVDYINDSKCTSLPAMLASVEAIDRPCILIAGGQEKSQVIDDRLMSVLQNRCRLIAVTGETATAWCSVLKSPCRPPAGNSAPPEASRLIITDNLESAVQTARTAAQMGDAVLFAPGAPSFDRYDNFAHRGDHFRSIVMQL